MALFDGLRIAAPRGLASQWVRMIWQCDRYRSPDVAERILPHGAMELSWELDGAHRFARGDRVDAIEGPVLIGARATPYWVETARPQRLFGVVFAPGAAPDLLGVSAAELRSGFHPLRAFPPARELEARLVDAPGWAARVRVLEGAFTRPPRLGRPLRALLDGWRSESRTSVRELCVRAGVSAPTFVKHVRHRLGLRPAELRQMHRFRAALTRLASRHETLAQTALAAGYSDQAHMSRAFRAHAELRPSAYRPLDPAHPFNITDSDVPFGLASGGSSSGGSSSGGSSSGDTVSFGSRA